MNDIAQWDALKTAIDQAHSIFDLKGIRDQAEAYRYALKLAGEAPEMVRKACQIKLRAERRAGELIKIMEKAPPGPHTAIRYQADTMRVPTYEEQGISKLDASKWQRIAAIDKEDFETWIEKAPDISTAKALSFAKEFTPKAEKAPKPVSEFSGRYAVILADPANTETDLLSLRLKSDDGDKTVADISEPNALLFFWSKAEVLEKSIKIMSSWGFQYETVAFTWIKRDRDGNPHLGKGDWTASNVELCLLGKKGDGLPRQSKEVSSVLETVVLEEGEKPAELRSRILALVGEVSRIELFGKHKVKGWDSYSD